MYLSGIVVTLVGVYMSDGAQVLEKGFFYGYTCFVWLVICKYLVGYRGVTLFCCCILAYGTTDCMNLQIQCDPPFLTIF